MTRSVFAELLKHNRPLFVFQHYPGFSYHLSMSLVAFRKPVQIPVNCAL
jgi:hypothetical protein